jgi:hypothetical protein
VRLLADAARSIPAIRAIGAAAARPAAAPPTVRLIEVDMLRVMPMQWYVNLVTIAAAGALGWIVLEFLGKPIQAFFDLRDQVRAQLLLLANAAPPKPRETISTSLEIQQYDDLKAGREAQRILCDLGSQMLAFSENEIAACNGIATFGFDAVAAGRGLIALSNIYYRDRTDRADFSSTIEGALRLKAREGSTHCEVVEQIAAGLNMLRLPSHKARMKDTGAKAARSLKRCVPPV